MSVTEWESLTLDEFLEVHRWQERRRDSDSNDRWSRMRLLACLLLQPHTSKRLKPTDLFELPGDPKSKSRRRSEKRKKMSKEERDKDAIELIQNVDKAWLDKQFR